MKLWLKYLLGALLGILCAFVLPTSNPTVLKIVDFLMEIVIRFGRYMIVPVMFFTVLVAFNRLRESRMLYKQVFWTGLSIAVSSIILTLVGIFSILMVKLPRIPITMETLETPLTLNVENLFKSLFPYSGFQAITDGSFLLAPYFLAAFIGGASTSDATLYRPIVQLSDALSKLMYNISTFFTEFLSVGMVAVLCKWTIEFRSIILSRVYSPLIVLLLVNLVIMAGIIYPLIIRNLCHDSHPYRILYASLCSLITAFFSGDSNLVNIINMRHCKESLGVRRRINGTVLPLFTVFARGGSSLVTVVGFIVIWRSYSSLAIPFKDVLWMMGMCYLISFLLGGFPQGGTFISLAVLCGLYGKGFENGFMLLKPCAPILCSFACAFDALTSVFGCYVVGVKTKLIEHHNINHYI